MLHISLRAQRNHGYMNDQGQKNNSIKKKKYLCIRTCTNECLLQNMDLMYTQKHKDSATERRRTCRHSSFTWTDTSYHKVLQASPLALENGKEHGTIMGLSAPSSSSVKRRIRRGYRVQNLTVNVIGEATGTSNIQKCIHSKVHSVLWF